MLLSEYELGLRQYIFLDSYPVGSAKSYSIFAWLYSIIFIMSNDEHKHEFLWIFFCSYICEILFLSNPEVKPHYFNSYRFISKSQCLFVYFGVTLKNYTGAEVCSLVCFQGGFNVHLASGIKPRPPAYNTCTQQTH